MKSIFTFAFGVLCASSSFAGSSGVRIDVVDAYASHKIYETATSYRETTVSAVENLTRNLSIVIEICPGTEYLKCEAIAQTPFFIVRSSPNRSPVDNQSVFISDEVLAPFIARTPRYTLQAVLVEKTALMRKSRLGSTGMTSDVRETRTLAVPINVNPRHGCPKPLFEPPSTFHGNQMISCGLNMNLIYQRVP